MMLELNEVSRRYRGTTAPAVSGVSLEVAEARSMALIGESGSGKTTLLRLIAGLEVPDDGAIRIGGQLVADAAAGDWVPAEKRRVGFVFQDGALFPHLSIARNVAYGMPKATRATRREAVAKWLDAVGLDGFQKRFPHQLSGGERQRVALARALAHEPDVVLLDEPFSNLDPSLRRELRDTMRHTLAEAGATSIMVTHDPADAQAVSDSLAVLRDGKIEQIGTPTEVYHGPASGYCARLFGPANRLVGEQGAERWVRPEDMAIVTANGEPGSIPVRVLELRGKGREAEITVESDDEKLSGGERWILYADNDAPLELGQQLWVRPTDGE